MAENQAPEAPSAPMASGRARFPDGLRVTVGRNGQLFYEDQFGEIADLEAVPPNEMEQAEQQWLQQLAEQEKPPPVDINLPFVGTGASLPAAPEMDTLAQSVQSVPGDVMAQAQGPFAPHVNQAIINAADAAGISRATMFAIARIESINGNPNAVSPSGRHHGLFQLSQAVQDTYGVEDPYDPAQNAAAAARYMADNARGFEQRFGREPTGGEIYMMHQQGLGGASVLFRQAERDPNIPARNAPGINPSHITQNSRSNPNITVGAFIANYTGRVDRFASEYADDYPDIVTDTGRFRVGTIAEGERPTAGWVTPQEARAAGLNSLPGQPPPGYDLVIPSGNPFSQHSRAVMGVMPGAIPSIDVNAPEGVFLDAPPLPIPSNPPPAPAPPSPTFEAPAAFMQNPAYFDRENNAVPIAQPADLNPFSLTSTPPPAPLDPAFISQPPPAPAQQQAPPPDAAPEMQPARPSLSAGDEPAFNEGARVSRSHEGMAPTAPDAPTSTWTGTEDWSTTPATAVPVQAPTPSTAPPLTSLPLDNVPTSTVAQAMEKASGDLASFMPTDSDSLGVGQTFMGPGATPGAFTQMGPAAAPAAPATPSEAHTVALPPGMTFPSGSVQLVPSPESQPQAPPSAPPAAAPSYAPPQVPGATETAAPPTLTRGGPGVEVQTVPAPREAPPAGAPVRQGEPAQTPETATAAPPAAPRTSTAPPGSQLGPVPNTNVRPDTHAPDAPPRMRSDVVPGLDPQSALYGQISGLPAAAPGQMWHYSPFSQSPVQSMRMGVNGGGWDATIPMSGPGFFGAMGGLAPAQNNSGGGIFSGLFGGQSSSAPMFSEHPFAIPDDYQPSAWVGYGEPTGDFGIGTVPDPSFFGGFQMAGDFGSYFGGPTGGGDFGGDFGGGWGFA